MSIRFFCQANNIFDRSRKPDIHLSNDNFALMHQYYYLDHTHKFLFCSIYNLIAQLYFYIVGIPYGVISSHQSEKTEYASGHLQYWAYIQTKKIEHKMKKLNISLNNKRKIQETCLLSSIQEVVLILILLRVVPWCLYEQDMCLFLGH